MSIRTVGKDLRKHHCHPNKSFCSELNLEDISDKDYSHAQKVWKEFEIKNLGEYHDPICSNRYIIACGCF